MKILNAVLAVFMLLFAAVQWNDPDGLHWALIYLAGALWCGVAALRPGVFAGGAGWWLFLSTVAATVFGLWHYWPQTEKFWLIDVWWETEEAREGMGMMILALCLVAAGLVARRTRLTG
ncbi:MAG: transmembrane 220 family protein [Pikeienuella sp.]|uniref:transmembrane 220 family protein n=1 Tax=Pikeienuella sp. TaxID=2831957 RepID=UPI00391CC84D